MFHIDASRAASWLTVAMSNETVMRWVQTHTDEFDWSLLQKNVVCCVSISTSPLIALAKRLFHIDNCSTQDLHSHSSETSARVELIDAVFRTLLPIRAANDPTRRYLDRKRILRRALELLETIETNTVYVEDLCAATGASERTIRNVFNEYLGMSPHRYLMVRRLHAIRDAISHAAPGETVTSICSRFGVWDFGRLANQYHDYFGHYPSQRLYKRVQFGD
jgi:AraC family ethanolamine operon transcriptional activator